MRAVAPDARVRVGQRRRRDAGGNSVHRAPEHEVGDSTWSLHMIHKVDARVVQGEGGRGGQKHTARRRQGPLLEVEGLRERGTERGGAATTRRCIHPTPDCMTLELDQPQEERLAATARKSTRWAARIRQNNLPFREGDVISHFHGACRAARGFRSLVNHHAVLGSPLRPSSQAPVFVHCVAQWCGGWAPATVAGWVRG